MSEREQIKQIIDKLPDYKINRLLIFLQGMQLDDDIEDENVVIIKNGRIEVGEDEDINLFSQLKDFIINEDMSNPSNYNKACELIDINNLAWYLAFNIYIGNKDCFFQNLSQEFCHLVSYCYFCRLET